MAGIPPFVRTIPRHTPGAHEGAWNLQDTVVEFVRKQVLTTRTAIARRFLVGAKALQDLLGVLVDDGTLARTRLRTRIHYLLASNEWRMCCCNGQCAEQMATLRDPGRRRLLRAVHPLGRFNTKQVKSLVASHLDWSRSMTHHHLQSLTDAGILSRVEVDHSDRRLAWYRVEPLLPPVAGVLGVPSMRTPRRGTTGDDHAVPDMHRPVQ